MTKSLRCELLYVKRSCAPMFKPLSLSLLYDLSWELVQLDVEVLVFVVVQPGVNKIWGKEGGSQLHLYFAYPLRRTLTSDVTSLSINWLLLLCIPSLFKIFLSWPARRPTHDTNVIASDIALSANSDNGRKSGTTATRSLDRMLQC